MCGVVEHDVIEVGGLCGSDARQRAHPHQHVAVAVEDDDGPRRLRQREPEADRRGEAHRSDHVELRRPIADA